MAPHPSATLFRRIAAAFYDALLIVAIFAVLTFVVVTARGDAVPPGSHVFQLALVITAAAYFAGFWVKGGQTPGMKTWRLRLETCSGGPIGWRSALIRFAGAILSIAVFGLGFLWALFDADRQTAHDRMAGTRLIFVPVSAPG